MLNIDPALVACCPTLARALTGRPLPMEGAQIAVRNMYHAVCAQQQAERTARRTLAYAARVTMQHMAARMGVLDEGGLMGWWGCYPQMPLTDRDLYVGQGG